MLTTTGRELISRKEEFITEVICGECMHVFTCRLEEQGKQCLKLQREMAMSVAREVSHVR